MTRPPDEGSGTEIRDWLDEVSETPPGDFSDVLQRAQELGGVQLSAQDMEDASRLPADEDELRARLSFGNLEDFLDAAAAFVAEQGSREPPPMRGGVPRRRGWASLGAGMAAVAAVAAVLVWWSLPRDALAPADADSAYAAAADRSDASAQAQSVDQRPALRQVARPTPAVGPPQGGEPTPEALSETPDAATPRVRPTPPRPSLEALDAEARAAWRSGELDRARRLFERLVSRGRSSERADVAYGDLFTLARRQGDDAALHRYWKRYVRRFPKGRYIDDAQAGLCRAAIGGARTRCWERYLKTRPRGTYLEDAQTALRSP